MLEIKNLTKTFGSFKALDDLTMTVPKGTVYGLVGPNGAGKSTAIRHALGVYRPDSGSITFDGQPVYENPEVKSRIGSIPDDGTTLNTENELFYIEVTEVKDHRIEKAIIKRKPHPEKEDEEDK